MELKNAILEDELANLKEKTGVDKENRSGNQPMKCRKCDEELVQKLKKVNRTFK